MSCMLLKIFIESPELREKYIDAVLEHNNSLDDNPFYNSGFDLFVPNNKNISYGKTTIIDTGVKCAGYWLNDDMTIGAPSAYYLYPRSSIIKTPLRMANSVGIIDTGYRGNLGCVVDCFKGYGTKADDIDNTRNHYSVEQYSRLFQVCAPNLGPVRVVLVGSVAELGTTQRGEGGFGSTGV